MGLRRALLCSLPATSIRLGTERLTPFAEARSIKPLFFDLPDRVFPFSVVSSCSVNKRSYLSYSRGNQTPRGNEVHSTGLCHRPLVEYRYPRSGSGPARIRTWVVWSTYDDVPCRVVPEAFDRRNATHRLSFGVTTPSPPSVSNSQGEPSSRGKLPTSRSDYRLAFRSS